VTFVIVPEFVARHWWERGLFNQSAKRLRAALLGRPHTVVVDMPYRRSKRRRANAPDVAAERAPEQPRLERA
jgi:hypothetical protein